MCANGISESGELTAGERIKLRRLNRGLSRRVVANLVGRSEEWLRLVETGRQRLDSVRVITRLAEVLRIDDLSTLIDWPLRQSPVKVGLAGEVSRVFRPIIVDHPAIHVHTELARRGRSVPEVVAELHRCQEIWATSAHRYTVLTERLAWVLAASRDLRWRHRDAETGELLVQAYQLSAQLLGRTGAHELAWTAADRSLAIAGQLDQPMLIAVSAWHIGSALLHLSRNEECHDYAAATAAYLVEVAPDAIDRTSRAALLGALYLLAAKGASGMLHLAEADRLTASARQLAHELAGDHEVLGLRFGPTEIALAQIEMALDHGDFDAAIRIAADVAIGDNYPIGGRSRYFIALAYAFVRHGDDVAAAFALAKAADACPEDLRHDRHAQRTLQHLLLHGNRLVRQDVARLAELAELT